MLDDAALEAMRTRNWVRQQWLEALSVEWGAIWSSSDSLEQKTKRAAEIDGRRIAIIAKIETPPDWEAQMSAEQRERLATGMRRCDELVAQMKSYFHQHPDKMDDIERLNEELSRELESMDDLFFH